MTGKIYVNIREVFPAGKITLKVEGKEKCKWYEEKTRTVGEGENMRIEHYEDKHDK